jgi:2-oxoglutarate/2-oxoacid ferredoxin oxidoreductase subunit alpha
MTERLFLQAGHAIAEAAIRAGCKFYSAYPIRPSSEIQEYMSVALPKAGGAYVSAASEIEAICMVAGAAAGGAPAMTASSSTGISLMQEQIAEAAGAGLPLVVVNGCRFVLQADYHQSVKGGGHGDYRIPVLAPSTTQELVDLTTRAFDLSWQYRHPVLLLTDAFMLSCCETVDLPTDMQSRVGADRWAITGSRKGSPRNLVSHVLEDPTSSSSVITSGNPECLARMRAIEANEVLVESISTSDAEIVVLCFGSVARVARTAVRRMRQAGLRVGLLRPITLWPFPTDAIATLPVSVRTLLVVELNRGQMVEDVRAAAPDQVDVRSFAGDGDADSGFGLVWSVDAIMRAIEQSIRLPV